MEENDTLRTGPAFDSDETGLFRNVLDKMRLHQKQDI